MDFTLTSYGAAGEVTGSKHLLQTPAGSRLLLDCGLFQGKREEAAEKNEQFGFDPSTLDAVLLSHAHVDHSGLLPKLGKEGFDGTVYCTSGTMELSHFMLLDSARIQEEDEKFFRKHDLETPLKKREPLYTTKDVEKVMQQFQGVNYRESFAVTDDVTATFLDAGHVLGSAMIILDIQTPEGVKKLVFSGDLGRPDMPILRDPDEVSTADVLLVESTYGDRSHEGVAEIEDDLSEIINATSKRGGKVLIPAFALERTQEMILRLENLMHANRIPNLPIYIDSPLAGKLTSVFERYPEYYDEEMKAKKEKRRQVFSHPNLRFTESTEDSKELNYIKHPCIIVSGSGMCENGRIRHHLKNNIEDHRNAVMIVGYQAEETLGRKLVEGNKVVKIFGREYKVNASLHVFKSLSAHADKEGLDKYVQSLKGLQKVIIVHGEQGSREAFMERIKGYAPDVEVVLPTPGVANDVL